MHRNVSFFVKVCLINTNKEWGGGEKWHYQAALKLKDAGHHVVVVADRNGPLAAALKDSVRLLKIEIGNLTFLNPLISNKISTFFKLERFDAIIMNLPRDVKAFSKPAAKAGTKKIVYRRGMNHPIKASLVNRFFYKRYVTDIIANSEAVRRSIFQNIPELEAKITTIQNGVNTRVVWKHEPPRVDKILIGSLGRLVDQKGHIDLIKLGKFFLSKGIAFHIFIGGEGPSRKMLESEIANNSLDDHLTLMGKVKPQDFFQRIDYFVFPSRFEGLSNAMLEAAQHGKPIFCYDVASNSEIVEHGISGYLVEPFDFEKLGSHLIELHNNPELYADMQRAGQAILRDKFDEDKLFKKLENLLSSDSQDV